MVVSLDQTALRLIFTRLAVGKRTETLPGCGAAFLVFVPQGRSAAWLQYKMYLLCVPPLPLKL